MQRTNTTILFPDAGKPLNDTKCWQKFVLGRGVIFFIAQVPWFYVN